MTFKSKAVAGVGTTLTTVSNTVQANTAQTIIGFSLANVTSGNINVTAKLIKADAPSAHLVKDATVLPGGALAVAGGDQKVVLEAGDYIQVSSNTASACDVLMSYLLDAN